MQTFLDPEKTSDGKLYAPIRYKQLVKERYIISRQCNTSYTDTGNITPKEREYIFEFIDKEVEERKKAYDEAAAQAKERSRRR